MRSEITVILGIILLCAAFGKQQGFYRIRGLSLRGFGRLVMRVLYGLAGIFLIALTLSEYFNFGL